MNFAQLTNSIFIVGQILLAFFLRSFKGGSHLCRSFALSGNSKMAISNIITVNLSIRGCHRDRTIITYTLSKINEWVT